MCFPTPWFPKFLTFPSWLSLCSFNVSRQQKHVLLSIFQFKIFSQYQFCFLLELQGTCYSSANHRPAWKQITPSTSLPTELHGRHIWGKGVKQVLQQELSSLETKKKSHTSWTTMKNTKEQMFNSCVIFLNYDNSSNRN